MTKAQLQSRWSKAALARVGDDLWHRRVPRDAQRRIVDGIEYIDLRGVFPARIIRNREMIRWDWTYADLRHANFGGKRQRSVECLFRSATLWLNVGDEFERCDFAKANLKGATLFGLYNDCTFRDANMVSVNFDSQSRIVRCDFRGAKLRKASMNNAVFEACMWESATFGGGVAVDTKFLGTRPTSEQLGETPLVSDLTPEQEAEIERQVDEEMRRQEEEANRNRRRRR